MFLRDTNPIWEIMLHYEQCQQRAADKGSNSFALGPNNGNNTTRCYVGSGMGGSGIVNTSLCSVAGNSAGNRMGRNCFGQIWCYRRKSLVE